MEDFVILCKIAKEFEECDEDCHNSIPHMKFEYKSKIWSLENSFSSNANKILEAIELCATKSVRRIGFVILDTKQYRCASRSELVLVQKRTNIKICSNELLLLSRLFPIIFVNYTADFEKTLLRGETPVIKNYVHTKLYNALYKKHQTMTHIETNIKLPIQFQPTLRRYQVLTVKWLLKRELHIQTCPMQYSTLNAVDNVTYVNKHNYCIYFQNVSESSSNVQLPPGGILADEMGLGKTVELIALILLNPRQNCNISYYSKQYEEIDESDISLKRRRVDGNLFCICTTQSKNNLILCTKCMRFQHRKCVNERSDTKTERVSQYLCPECWNACSQGNLLKSATTIVVSPNTIKMQWMSEIGRHTEPTLRVLSYEGVNTGRWINPAQLNGYDVILTDYNILRNEIYHTSQYTSDRKMRHKPRCMRLTSPLLMVEWWRVCLDEAQMVECKTSKAADLVRMLPAINRWAVTGTPIQHTIEDLYPLLKFVGFHEICEPFEAWDNMVINFLQHVEQMNEDTQSPLIDLLQKCMWRTCKSKVDSELGIPPQTEIVHKMVLSDLENLFYQEQHNDCQESFNKVVELRIAGNRKEKVAKLSSNVLKVIMQPLLKIRQCCTMPVVQSSINKKNISGNAQKQFMQPKELHSHLKSTNELDCKSQLRTIASSYNGIAGLYFVKNNFSEAIKYYEFVLKLANEHNEKNISVDSLLQIHALYNILQANLFLKEPLVSADNITKYEEQFSALEWKYLEPFALQLNSTKVSYELALRTLENLRNKAGVEQIVFVATIAKTVADSESLHTMLISKIKDDFYAQYINKAKLSQLNSMNELLYIIHIWHEKVSIARNKLIDAFDQLKFYTENMLPRHQIKCRNWRDMSVFIAEVYNCHLSEFRETSKDNNEATKEGNKNKKTFCKLCNIRDVFNEFECLLFDKSIDEDTAVIEGAANPSFEVNAIKFVFNFLKSKPTFQKFQADFDLHCEIIESLQNLCKKIIKYWIEIEYTVKVYDELDMCKLRISITTNEKKSSNFCILPHEIDEKLAELWVNLNEAQNNFRQKLARLNYIKHLEADSKPEPCPICRSELLERFVVLECGHVICIACLKAVRVHLRKEKPPCPICRNVSKQVYYVTSFAKKPYGEENLIGNFSSKITYIVCLILKLKKEDIDNSLKILIFSEWEPILKAIAIALSENNIHHRLKCSARNIEEFKSPKMNITCMLMPFSRGSKGLNLIEATHVFLVEPILNPGEELQAIGRVHRFGQTRPTTVHRFIVNNTIEQNIYNFIASANGQHMQTNSQWQLENMSVDHIRNLFKLNNDSCGEAQVTSAP